uniref:Secreted protein n=1 Tax=Panagrellus redivivus TaxID=6233 RepID=A0A7E4UZH8_PANRE
MSPQALFFVASGVLPLKTVARFPTASSFYRLCPLSNSRQFSCAALGLSPLHHNDITKQKSTVFITATPSYTSPASYSIADRRSREILKLFLFVMFVSLICACYDFI